MTDLASASFPPLDPARVLSLTRANFREMTRAMSLTARAVLKGALVVEIGALAITFPNGQAFGIEGARPGPRAVVHVHDERVVRRVLLRGDLAFHEGYVDGAWSSPDVTAVLELFARNSDIIDRHLSASRLVRLGFQLKHWLNRNSRAGSKRNISAHYDLGNAFYSRWLDPGMTYSSALFENGETDLAAGQTAKYRHIAEMAGIRPGDHVLEIGCGWGGFAEFAAREYGARVTGLTISREQLAYARARIDAAGLADRVELKFQDYRDETGRYDRIVSIEMFEAVGERWWQPYFDILARCLKPGGRAALQVICIQERFFEAYRAKPDFIQHYVFPGGMLPTSTALRQLSGAAGLVLTGEREFGQDYAATVRAWRQAFLAAWPEIAPLGFDERFKRLWAYYLHYCEAGFAAGNIDVRQVAFERV